MSELFHSSCPTHGAVLVETSCICRPIPGGRRVVFVAHPVAGDVAANVASARRWLRWLMLSEPDVSFIAPWLTAIEAGALDDDPSQRERGFLDNEAVLARCEGLVLVGGRISAGMFREWHVAEQLDLDIDDLIYLGAFPPAWSIENALDGRDLAVAAGLMPHGTGLLQRRRVRR